MLIVTASHYSFVRENRTYFVAVALITTLQERADAALTRGVLRLSMALIAATLGMTNHAVLAIVLGSSRISMHCKYRNCVAAFNGVDSCNPDVRNAAVLVIMVPGSSRMSMLWIWGDCKHVKCFSLMSTICIASILDVVVRVLGA